jgi:hypothetical protein
MTQENATTSPPRPDFDNCPRCGMEILRAEVGDHLAHAHNIGPEREKKDRKGKDGRRSR